MDVDLPPEYARKNFTWDALRCKGVTCGCGGVAYITDQSLDKLQRLRDRLNTPLTLNSAARCEQHNKDEGGASRSRHISHMFNHSCAFDVVIPPGLTCDELVGEAEEVGFKGIGRYDTFVHVDDRSFPARWDKRTN